MKKVLFVLFASLISTNAFAYDCMKDDFGHVVCGGNCMKDDFGHVQCSETDNGVCAKDDFGHVQCEDPSRWGGQIDSMKDDFGHVNFGSDCEKDDFGHVVCHDPDTQRGHRGHR